MRLFLHVLIFNALQFISLHKMRRIRLELELEIASSYTSALNYFIISFKCSAEIPLCISLLTYAVLKLDGCYANWQYSECFPELVALHLLTTLAVASVRSIGRQLLQVPVPSPRKTMLCKRRGKLLVIHSEHWYPDMRNWYSFQLPSRRNTVHLERKTLCMKLKT